MNCLGLFAKHWTPGRVKTRLAAAIGPEAAAQLHREFVFTLCRRFTGLADRQVLAFSPPESRTAFAEEILNWELVPQSDGDLGQRMAAFFRDSFTAGADRVVLIGSDSPTLPVDYVREAFSRLATDPVVIGPATDGGYYLLGMRRGELPPIFAGIDWSTPRVLAQTTARLPAVSLLPEWFDVDELSDLQRLRDELADQPESQYDRLRELLRRVLSNQT